MKNGLLYKEPLIQGLYTFPISITSKSFKMLKNPQNLQFKSAVV